MEMDIKNRHVRRFLRTLAGAVLIAYAFKIGYDKIVEGKIYLDVNDGYVIMGCISLLLAIEAVRAYVKRKLEKDACNHED